MKMYVFFVLKEVTGDNFFKLNSSLNTGFHQASLDLGKQSPPERLWSAHLPSQCPKFQRPHHLHTALRVS